MKKRRLSSIGASIEKDRGYDLGVRAPGPGLEGQGELIAPPGVGDQLNENGTPKWDESERAAPLPPLAADGLDISAPKSSPFPELSLEELRKRAQALSIPGQLNMTKMQLAAAVHDAMSGS